MLVKFSYLLILIFMCSILFTACWDSRDIQEREIVSAVITDYKNGAYAFIVEVANIKGAKKASSGSESGAKFTILKSQGSSLISSRFDLDRKTDSPVFLGATRAIVLTESLAKHGIEEYMNRIRGTADYRKSIDVLTTSTPPEAILKDQPENDISAGFAIEDTLKALKSEGASIHINVGDILQALAVENTGFILPQINIQYDENTLTGYSVFKDAKMIGAIPAEESKGLVYLLSPNSRFFYDVDYEGSKLTIKTTLKSRKIQPIFDGKSLIFNVKLEFRGEVHYMDKLTPVNAQTLEKYTGVLKDLLYKDIEATLQKSQKEFGCDYLQFYKHFRIAAPQAFKSIDWNKAFCGAEMKIDIKATVKPAGMYELNPKTSE